MLRLFTNRRHVILVGHFIVAEGLAKCGFTSEVIAMKLRDRLLHITNISGTEKQHERLSMDQALPLIKAESSGLSLGRMFLGLKFEKKYKVSGELVSCGELITLTVRVDDAPGASLSGSLSEIDDLINGCAIELMRRTEPYVLAAYSLTKGDVEQVLELVHHCMAKLPASEGYWAHNLWGVYFLERNEYRKAADCFRRALKIRPDFGIALYNLALAVDGMRGSLDECIELYVKAAQKWNSALVWHGLGYALVRQQRNQDALKAFEKADRFSPYDPFILKDWGETLFREGQYKEALEKFELASMADTKNPDLKFATGLVLEELGEVGRSIREYEEALRLDGDHGGARTRLDALKQARQLEAVAR